MAPIPTRQFVLYWIAASFPLHWSGELLLDPLLEGMYWKDLGYWSPILPFYAAISTATAFLQSKVLTWHRRPVSAWMGAALAGHLAAALVFLSLHDQWRKILFRFGAVRLPESWFWIPAVVITTSCTLLIAFTEAWALWGRRWTSSWPLWVAGRIGIALGLLATQLALGLHSLGPIAGFAYETLPGRMLGAGAWHLGSAAATAWMLDRLAFREPLPGA